MTCDKWGVYLVRCSDGTLYCGATNNVEKRVGTHNKGKGARYTSKRIPVVLVAWTGNVFEKGDALRFERKVKKLFRSQKIAAVLAVAKKHGG
jgi:putative endonuclease